MLGAYVTFSRGPFARLGGRGAEAATLRQVCVNFLSVCLSLSLSLVLVLVLVLLYCTTIV